VLRHLDERSTPPVDCEGFEVTVPSRWFIKTSFIYFALSMLMGMALLLQPVMGWPNAIQSLKPVYLHFIFIGWVTQLIMGVGYWMFPKYTTAKPRGDVWLVWAVYLLLNLGMIFRTLGEPAVMLNPLGGWGWMLAAASTFLLLAGWGYVWLVWGRIKER
jgi:hypothetical protein